MNYRWFGTIAVFALAVVVVVGCSNKKDVNTVVENNTQPPAPTPEESQESPVVSRGYVAIPGDYVLQTDVSVIRWEGKGVGKAHGGTIALSEGSLTSDEIAFSKGSFTIDMASMVGHDGEPEGVVNHLKGEDFFDVAQYPESKFVFTGMQRKGDNSFTISGNLTIKDQTHTILIPAFVQSIPDGYRATAAFSIDRTKWGIRYGSNNFFDNLGNRAVDDMISFEIDLTAISAAAIAEEQK